MGIAIRSIGGFLLGVSTLASSFGRNNEIKAEEPTNNLAILGSLEPISDAKQKKEEVRKWAIENRYTLAAHIVVCNPDLYVVDESDIDFVIGKKMILVHPETGVLEFVEDNEANVQLAKKQGKNVIRRDESSLFNLGIGKNPLTTKLIKQDKNLRKRVQDFLVKNLQESFCLGLAMNENDYPVDWEIIEVCTNNPKRQIAYYFAQKKDFNVNDNHRNIVRTDYKCPLSQGLVKNPGYVKAGLNDVPEEDKKVCREHPKSYVAAALSSLDIYKFEEVDMETAIATTMGLDDLVVEERVVEDDTSSYAANIVKKLNRRVKQNEIETARNNPNSDFAQIAGNKFYLEGRTDKDIEEEIDYAVKLAKEAYDKDGSFVSPIFSEELFSNPALRLSERIINLVMTEPYCNIGIAEAIAEREDFPVNGRTIKFSEDNPYSQFTRGFKTNLAIRELRKVVLEINEMIAKEKQELKAVELVKGSLQGIDKLIEDAKGTVNPAEKLGTTREMFLVVKNKLETILASKVEVKDITDDTFKYEVLESSMPVLVDFWAPWCGPCKKIEPTVKELATYYKGVVKVAKVNIDDNPNLQGEYIQVIPTLIVFKDGKVQGKIVGAVSKEKIIELIEKANK